MSVNQSRAEKNEPSQYRKSGRSGNSVQQRNSQGSGKGGGGGNTAPPSSSPSFSSSRSFKKSNNAQGGQSRVGGGIVNSDSNKPSTGRAIQNGAHTQSQLPGAPNPPVTGLNVKPNEQKNTRVVPKSPSSGVTPVSSETIRPLTPGKGLGDASRSLPLQFGSIRPDFVNVMQVPARTSSAPPDFDEQKRDQARSLKPASTLSNPPGTQQQLPKKDTGPIDQSVNTEAHPMPIEKKDVPVSVGPTVTQIPKHPVIPMQVPFHHPNVPPVQFGSPNPQLQGQSLTNTMPIPMPIPVPINPSVQPQVFVPAGLQPHHPMQPQGIIRQGQNLNFSSQMGGPPQMPQLGNLGTSISPQFQQQQGGKFAVPRKTTVKITHPDTHEELRLDNSGSSGAARPPHHLPSQNQPIPSYPPAHQINYYTNSYSPSSLFFPPQSSLPLTTPSSQAPRFFNPPVIMNPSSLNSFMSNKVSVPFEPYVSVQVTVKPPVSSHGEKVADSSSKDSATNHRLPHGDSNPISPKRDSVASKSSVSTAGPVSAENLTANSVKVYEQKKPGKKGQGLQQNEAGLHSASDSSVSSQSLDHGTSISGGTCRSVDTTATTPASSGVPRESTGAPVQLTENTGSEITVATSPSPQNEAVGPKEQVDNMIPIESKIDEIHKTSEPLNQTEKISDLKLETLNPDKSLASEASRSDGAGSKEIASVSVSSVSEGTESNTNGPVSKPLLEPTKGKNTMSKWKKKKKEILQKADAAGTTFDLYNAYKGPEEKNVTSTSTENMETEAVISKNVPPVSSSDVINEKGGPGQSKADLDDWEEAADLSTPKLVSPNKAELVKKYSRDFLLKFSEHCISLPEGFQITPDTAEAFVLNISRDYPSPGRVVDRSTGGSRLDRRGSGMGGGDDDKWNKMSGPSPNMRLDMGYGGNVVGFRPGQGGNYGVLRNQRGQVSPVQYSGGILSGPMQSMQRNSADSDRWQRATGYQKGLMPSPHTPLQVMHKAEKKYEVGKITDEEQAKQRLLKGILNKLTPQNFEKLFEQVKQVNIDNAGTLTGVISQIFDKALMEPTFCEMYANFCFYLAGELPDFNEDNEKITFKRLLLNKCQEEFERGEREQEEANRTEEEGETKQTEEEREEKRIRARRRMLGNIRLIGELYKKKMLTERIMHECIKKLLGQYQNPDEEDVEALCKLMSTIGEIIDHPKAKEHMDVYFDMMAKLSNNMKLSSRVRFMLKDSIDLRKNKWQQRRKVEGPKKIEEVHRDAAQERQAQTSRLARGGPNMDRSSVRRGQPVDYSQRGSNMMMTSLNPGGGGYRNLPQQMRGGYGNNQDERHSFENRVVSVPLPQRPMGDNDSITLGPQGGLARGMASRGQVQYSMQNVPEDSGRTTAGLNGYSGSRDDGISRHAELSSMPERKNVDRGFDKSTPTSPTMRGRVAGPNLGNNVISEKGLSKDRLRDMSIEAIKEFYSAKDEKEVALCIKDLNDPSFYPTMISLWVTDSFERKDMERDLMAKLLINLTKSRDAMLSPDNLIKGFESVLATLEDTVNDAPKAADFLGRIFAKVIIENVITMSEIGRLIYEGGEEEGRLVDIGLAAEVLGSTLEIIKSEKGEAVLNEIRVGSNLRLEKFRPPESKKALRLDKFI